MVAVAELNWLPKRKCRLIYQEFLSGAGGDIFANLAGSTSRGTFAFGKENKDQAQVRQIAGGLNLPNKKVLQGVQYYQAKNPASPIMAHWLQSWLVASIGVYAGSYKDGKHWDSFFDDFDGCHSVWASQHPGGMTGFEEHSWIDLWRTACAQIGWEFFPVAPVIKTFDAFAWTVQINSTGGWAQQQAGKINLESGSNHSTIFWAMKKVRQEIKWWQDNLPKDVLQFEHIQMIVDDKREELYTWISKNVSSDLDRDNFDFIYTNYRDQRIQDYFAWRNQHQTQLEDEWDDLLTSYQNAV